MTAPVVGRKFRRMILRDGGMIDVSTMTPEDLAEFVVEIERLTDSGVQLIDGVEYVVEGEVFPKGVRVES